MPRGKALSPETKTEIIKKIRQGKGAMDIARKYKISPGYIYSLKSKMKKTDEEGQSAQPSQVKVTSETVEETVTIQSPVIESTKALSLADEIRQQISIRQSEITTLENTLTILDK